VRLVSYNILNGGEGRADPLAEILVAQRADIVVLLEATNADVLDRIADRLKMDYFHARGPEHAAAILSGWPITETIDHGALHPEISKSFFEATVITPSGTETWNIAGVHLHARAGEENDRVRRREAQVVLDVFSSRRRRDKCPHLIAGDFNAHTPAVVQQMQADGYVDTLEVADPDVAKQTGTYTTQSPKQRFDFIFAFGIDAARIRNAWIEQDRLAKYASDHFPVGVEIE
jgi:endonuclease/exonuclease/phosphatase family metal-dependent hydrolase